MGRVNLSEQARSFITSHLHSVEDLEVLMLVRTDPWKEWSADEISAPLQLTPVFASNRLVGLYLQGLLTHPESAGPMYRFRYCPSSRSMESITAEIALAFENERELLRELLPPHPHSSRPNGPPGFTGGRAVNQGSSSPPLF
jgi:hypothetical protein